jgi:hypothetical protein
MRSTAARALQTPKMTILQSRSCSEHRDLPAPNLNGLEMNDDRERISILRPETEAQTGGSRAQRQNRAELHAAAKGQSETRGCL